MTYSFIPYSIVMEVPHLYHCIKCTKRRQRMLRYYVLPPGVAEVRTYCCYTYHIEVLYFISK